MLDEPQQYLSLSFGVFLHLICYPLRTVLERLFHISLASSLASISCQRQGLAFGCRFLPQTCVLASRVLASRAHLCLWPSKRRRGILPNAAFMEATAPPACGGQVPATESLRCDLQTSRAQYWGCCLEIKKYLHLIAVTICPQL